MQGETESDTENISDGEEMTKNINNTRSETKFALVEDPLNIYRIASDQTTLVSEIPNISDEENIIIVPGQEETPFFIVSD